MRAESRTTTEIEVTHFVDGSHERFDQQMIVITVFYLLSCIADIFYINVGSKEMEKGYLVCFNDSFIVTTNNAGSIALLIYTLMCYAYASVMLYVFYFIPKKNGLVLDFMTGTQPITGTGRISLLMTKSLQAQESNAKDLIKAL